MKNIIYLMAVILLLFGFNCKNAKHEEQPSITEEVIDGVRVVHNLQNNRFKPSELEVDLTIGVNEGDENYMLLDPKDIDSDSLGNIYIVESANGTIRKFDRDGKFVSSIGRKGQGPGEFLELHSIEINNKDEIYAFDSNQRKIDVFNPAGELLKTIRMTRVRVLDFALDENGDIYIGQEKYRETEEQRRREYVVSRFYPEKNLDVDIYSKRPQRRETIIIKKKRGELRISRPLYVRWSIGPNNMIYVEGIGNYEIEAYSAAKKIMFKFDRVLMTGQKEALTKQEYIDGFSRRTIVPGESGRSINIYPLFRSISIDNQGRVWVALMTSQSYVSSQKASIFDVFSSEGMYLFTTIIDLNIRSKLLFKNDHVYALVHDESEFPKAVRFHIEEN